MTTKNETSYSLPALVQVIEDSRQQVDQMFSQIVGAIGDLSTRLTAHLTLGQPVSAPMATVIAEEFPGEAITVKQWTARRKAKKKAATNVEPPSTLMGYVVKALAAAEQPLTTRELFNAIRADGWQSESAKPISIVTIGLRSEIKKRGKKSRIVRDAVTGTYRLAGA